MKRFLCLFTLIIVNTISYANDTLIQKNNGGNEYSLSRTNDIVIENEKLTFDVFDDYYITTVDYIFKNNGKEYNLDVGFPSIKYLKVTSEITQEQEISNFKTYVNNKEVEYKKVAANVLLAQSNNEIISSFYVKEVLFPANSIVNIKVCYKSTINKNYWLHGIEYLLGSATTWSGIKTLHVTINLHSDKLFCSRQPSIDPILSNKIVDISTSYDNSIRSLNITYENVQLVLPSKFLIYLNSQDEIFGFPWDYNFEYMSYSIYDFEMLTDKQLRLSRNLIYAWHGYQFKDKELQKIFSDLYEYDEKVKKGFNENTFNSFERENLEKISTVEKERLLTKKGSNN